MILNLICIYIYIYTYVEICIYIYIYVLFVASNTCVPAKKSSIFDHPHAILIRQALTAGSASASASTPLLDTLRRELQLGAATRQAGKIIPWLNGGLSSASWLGKSKRNHR